MSETSKDVDAIKAKIAYHEKRLAKCQDAYLKQVLRETIRYWQQRLYDTARIK